MSLKTFTYNYKVELENGNVLPNLQIAYHSWGKLNANGDNVVWVCHALTANSNVLDWWNGLFGENCLFNPEEYFIVCPNNLGSCYGTTGPLTENTDTKEKWYSTFPNITIKDMVWVHEILRNHLNIKKIKFIIGGSQGGQQALEWNIHNPDIFENLILLATNAKHSAWGIAFNESQRMSIYADETYYQNIDNGGAKGLAAARSIALLSYRNYNAYVETQSEITDELPLQFKAESYQNYQGKKLVDRFNAYSYVTLSKAMDSHNVYRGNGQFALRKIKAKTLLISISSDILFPPVEQKKIATEIDFAVQEIIDSKYGHDGFLIETEKITHLIRKYFFVEENKTSSKEISELSL